MTTTKNLDTVALLEQDHREVEGLLEKISDTTERAGVTRQEVFAKLKLLLDAHAHMEETIYYPVVEAAKATHKITLEGIEEHAVVKTLLQELEQEDHQTEQWTAEFKVLKENLEHHVKEEEEDMFPKSRKILGEEKLLELGTAMQADKEKYLQQHAA